MCACRGLLHAANTRPAASTAAFDAALTAPHYILTLCVVPALLRCLYNPSAGIPSPFRAIRYHSLAGRPDTLPACLEVTCTSGNGIIQGVRHRELAVEGVQFHPESILTEHGKTMLANFLAVTDARAPTTAAAAAGGAVGASAAAGATGASAAASGVSASGAKAVTEAPIHSVAGVAVPATA